MGRAAELLGRARAALPDAAYRTGDFDGVEALLREALGQAEADGDLGDQAGALDQLGVLLHFRTIDRPRAEWGEVDPGPEQELFERALAMRRQLGDPNGVAESLLHLGWVHQVLRDQPDVSLPLFREAMALAEPDGDPYLRAELHRHIGFHVALADGRPAEAVPFFERSLALWRTMDEPAWVVHGLVALARCESGAGRHSDALAHGREALELVRGHRFRGRVVWSAEETARAVEEAAGR